MNAPSQPLFEASATGAADAVRELREALIAGDVDRAQARRWVQPRPPGERDLLSDLAAAEGLTLAVKRLARFWSKTEVQLEHVRPISPVEAEVYELVSLPGEALRIVSLVRRESASSPWGVVCTTEASDERLSLWVAVEAEQIDDVAWSRAFAEPGDLLMTDDGGVLGHPDRGWLVHVRGPYEPSQWPENLPGEGGRLVELILGLSAEPTERRAQLRWALAAAVTTLDELGGTAAYRPAEKKLLLPEAVRLAAKGELGATQAFHFWARSFESNGHVVTEGMHLLGLPELEAPIDVLGGAERARAVVEWLATSMLDSGPVPTLGTELVLGEESVVLVAGRRGRRRGVTYGRWGAYRLADEAGPFGRGSRTRLRVPPELLV